MYYHLVAKRTEEVVRKYLISFSFFRSKQGLRWKYSENLQNRRLLCEICAPMSFSIAFATSFMLDIFIICKSSKQMYSLQIHWTNVFFTNPVSHFKNASPHIASRDGDGDTNLLRTIGSFIPH